MPDADHDQTTLRQQIKRRADELGVDPEHLLIQSKRRDPRYKGTDADHAKAKWFAELWQRAVQGRDEDRIHIRGVHYFVLMSMDDSDADAGLDLDGIPIDLDPADLPTLPEDLLEPPTNCSWNRYANTTQCFDYLTECAKLARILGYIPLDGLVDEKHNQRVVHRYQDHRTTVETDDVTVPSGVDLPPLPDVDEYAGFAFAEGEGDEADAAPDPTVEDVAEWVADDLASRLVDRVSFDEVSQQPLHVELWCEKTLPDYIHRICRAEGVNAVVEGEGDLSLTIAHDLVQRVNQAEKPAVVLYLSDHDPRGSDMAVNVASKVSWLEQRGDLQERVFIEQLAVTGDQVDEYGLPTEPVEGGEGTGTGAKAYDTLTDTWQARHGDGACELNVLEGIPDLYKHIVREGVHPYTDPDLAQKNRLAKRRWQQEATDILVDTLLAQDLDEDLDRLEDWVATFNARLGNIQSALEDLHHLQDEGFLAEWEKELEDIVDDVEYPVVTVPEGEGADPENPLYDSAREYSENLQRVDAFKRGS